MLRARTIEAKDARRRAVLNAALDEFFERGFTAARMDDIARRAGLSKGALYLYFDSKEELFSGLVETIAMPNLERVEQLVGTTRSPTEAIRLLMAFAPRLIVGSPLPRIVKVLIADSGAFPEVVRDYRRQVIDRVLGAIARLLERGRATGEFQVDDPHLAARLVVAPIVLSAMWRVVFETDPEAQVDVEALFALHEQFLLRALSAKGTES